MLTVNKNVLAAVAIAAAGFAGAASADTAVADFQVKITIQKACKVTAGIGAADIDFGTVPGLQATDAIANNLNKLSVLCSKSVPYDIGLLPSNGNTAGAGVMSGTDSIPNQLRSVSGTGAAWGNVVGTNTVHSTGTGIAQPYTVYASVLAANLNVTPGAYLDNKVTVTVTY